jgi:hypothetical protein
MINLVRLGQSRYHIIYEVSGIAEDDNMTANPPQSSQDFAPSPKVQAQVAELRELATQFPEPTWAEVLPDWQWLHAQLGTPVMEPYFEKLVAVYEKQIVGFDPEDELALRIRLAKEFQRHPERFVISYLG